MLNFNYLLGEKLEVFENIVKKYGYSVRVVKNNGVLTVCTRDYKLDRLNVEVWNNKISAIRNYG
jgi:hypothetical protein